MRNKLKIKVCGMRDTKNILDVAALNPDYMGFIFYEKSKRFVGNSFSIPKAFPDNINKAGVFVNESVDNILSIVSKHKLDVVQLHGDESPEICERLHTKVKVIKVFRVDELFDFNSTKEFNSYADFFLFDTKGENYGGTGQAFNWDILAKYDQRIPFFLSGGLSVENISKVKVLKELNLYALDFNSQIELEPGIKHTSKLNSILSILNTNY
jgi:phosphoribosylanthranilate isomerase